MNRSTVRHGVHNRTVHAFRKAVIALLLTAMTGVVGMAGGQAKGPSGDLLTAGDVSKLFGHKWLASGGTWLDGAGDEEGRGCGAYDPTEGYACDLHGEAADDGWPEVGIGIPPVPTEMTLLEHIEMLWGPEDPPTVVLDAVPDVGDEAYLVTGTDMLGSTLAFRAGGTNVTIQYQSALDRPRGSAESPKAIARLEKLARVVAARLGGAPSASAPASEATPPPAPSEPPRTPPPATPAATEIPPAPTAPPASPAAVPDTGKNVDQSFLDVWSFEVEINDHSESETPDGTQSIDLVELVHFTAGSRGPNGLHRATFEGDLKGIYPADGCTWTYSVSGSGGGLISVGQIAAGEFAQFEEHAASGHYDLDPDSAWAVISLGLIGYDQTSNRHGCGRDEVGYDSLSADEPFFLPGTVAQLLAAPIGTVYRDTQSWKASNSATETPWVHVVTVKYTATKGPPGSGSAQTTTRCGPDATRRGYAVAHYDGDLALAVLPDPDFFDWDVAVSWCIEDERVYFRSVNSSGSVTLRPETATAFELLGITFRYDPVDDASFMIAPGGTTTGSVYASADFDVCVEPLTLLTFGLEGRIAKISEVAAGKILGRMPENGTAAWLDGLTLRADTSALDIEEELLADLDEILDSGAVSAVTDRLPFLAQKLRVALDGAMREVGLALRGRDPTTSLAHWADEGFRRWHDAVYGESLVFPRMDEAAARALWVKITSDFAAMIVGSVADALDAKACATVWHPVLTIYIPKTGESFVDDSQVDATVFDVKGGITVDTRPDVEEPPPAQPGLP
jgi:hypothetical protein